MSKARIKKLLEAVGNFQTRAVLTIFYIFLAVPTGLLARIFGDSLQLKRRRAASSNWHPKEFQNNDSKRASRQY